MLNPFPELLILSLLAPTLLRLGLGLLLLRFAWRHFTRERREDATPQLHATFGIAGVRAVWLLAATEAVMALMFIIGFYTQIAALAGIFWSLLFIFYIKKRCPMIAEQTKSFYFLVLVICLSLMLSGAGGIAVDIPL